MTNLHIIGNSGKRKSNYDPNLAEQINKQVEEEGRRKKLEEKLKKKTSKQPTTPPETIPKQPTTLPSNLTYSFLEGDFGKLILEEYNRRVEQQYNNNPKLKVLSYNEKLDVVTGSNTFAPIIVNQILEEQNSQYRVSTLSQIEQSLKQSDPLKIKGNNYIDLGIILRSRENPNQYLAGNLADQLEQRNITQTPETPIYIPPTSLALVNDANSLDYKLSFLIKDNAEIIQAPKFSNKYNQKTFLETDNQGFPIYTEKGSRRSRTASSGLCGLDLVTGLDLDSGWDDLSYSYAGGRVVVVRATGTPQNFPTHNSFSNTIKNKNTV